MFNVCVCVCVFTAPQDMFETSEQGGCPTAGCKGVGHIKGARYSGHHRCVCVCPVFSITAVQSLFIHTVYTHVMKWDTQQMWKPFHNLGFSWAVSHNHQHYQARMIDRWPTQTDSWKLYFNSHFRHSMNYK